MNKERNYLLEMWRFVFCMMVLGFHYFAKIDGTLFHAGYLGVEFFFLVSGYFIGQYYTNHLKGKEVKERIQSVGIYIWSRIKRLYPLYLFALLLAIAVRTIINHYTISDIISLIKNCYAEFLLLQWTPLGNEVLISADWYIPAVFFGSLLFVLILAITGKFGGYILAPIISFLIYRYYFILIGKIDIIVYHHCVLRGIAGLGLGVFVYFLCQLVRQYPKWLEIVLYTLANMSLVGIFVYSNFGHRSKWDYVVIGIYAISLFILMSCNPLKLNLTLQKVFSFMGKSTYPIYIFQMPIIELFLTFCSLP